MSMPSSSLATGDEARLEAGEGLERGEVARVLHRDHVARVEEHPRHEVDALLRAAGDEHLFSVLTRMPRRRQPRRRSTRAAGRSPRSCCTGARARPSFAQHLGVRLGDGLDREELRRGQAAGEGEDVGPLGHLEDFSHRGGRHARHAAGEAERWERCSSVDAIIDPLLLGRGDARTCVSSLMDESTMVVCVRVTPGMVRSVSTRSRSRRAGVLASSP